MYHANLGLALGYRPFLPFKVRHPSCPTMPMMKQCEPMKAARETGRLLRSPRVVGKSSGPPLSRAAAVEVDKPQGALRDSKPTVGSSFLAPTVVSPFSLTRVPRKRRENPVLSERSPVRQLQELSQVSSRRLSADLPVKKNIYWKQKYKEYVKKKCLTPKLLAPDFPPLAMEISKDPVRLFPPLKQQLGKIRRPG